MRTPALLILGLPALLVYGCSSIPVHAPEGSDSATRASLPMTVEQNLPIVEARVGAKRVRLLVDTGSFETITLRDGVLDAAEYEDTGGGVTMFDARGNRFVLRRVIADEVGLGEIRLRKVRCYIGPHESRLPPSPHLDGVIGLGILDLYTVTFDAGRGQLSLARGESASMPGSRPLPFRRTGEGIVTRGRSGGRPLSLIWDTGASHSVIRSRAAGDAPARREGEHTLVELPSITVAGSELGEVGFVVIDFRYPHADAILGNNFLMRRPFRIDFQARVIHLGALAAR